MKIAAAIGVLVIVLLAGAVLFIYSGVYDVAATVEHTVLTKRVLRIAMEQSVKRRARDVNVPELDDPAKVHAGLRSFQAMCVTCHRAPGAEKPEINEGLHPRAPDLAEAAKNWSPAELYLIIKRGIKDTGMPAWGPTHSEEELWELVAFLNIFPTMPDAEYRGAVEYYAKSGAGGDNHRHGRTH
jgi:mono/diheme cytochrome c family protein